MLLRDIWDMFSLEHFDPIKRMIPLTAIPLSDVHCITLLLTSLAKICQGYVV